MPRFFQGLEVPLETEAALKTLPSLDSVDDLLQIVLEGVNGEPPGPESLRRERWACGR